MTSTAGFTKGPWTMCAELAAQARRLDALANTLDMWAEQSLSGGWSTHQVKANRDLANDCRRDAATIRAALAKVSP